MGNIGENQKETQWEPIETDTPAPIEPVKPVIQPAEPARERIA